MNPRGRPRKRQLGEESQNEEGQKGQLGEKSPILRESVKEKFPYEKGQICADVKIVEIKPEVERSIGFVYAKRGVIKDDRGRVVNTDGILHGQWQEKIHWMTVSDFKSFVKAQLDSGRFVRKM